MIFDRLTEFSALAGSSVAIAAGSKCLDNYIDLSNPSTLAKDIGNGENIFFILEATADIVTGGSAGTIQFKLGSSDTIPTDSATLSSANYHWTGPSQTTGATASAANKTLAGTKIAVVSLPLDTYKKYLAVEVTVGTTTLTGGTVRAFLALDPTGTKPYPAAVTY